MNKNIFIFLLLLTNSALFGEIRIISEKHAVAGEYFGVIVEIIDDSETFVLDGEKSEDYYLIKTTGDDKNLSKTVLYKSEFINNRAFIKISYKKSEIIKILVIDLESGAVGVSNEIEIVPGFLDHYAVSYDTKVISSINSELEIKLLDKYNNVLNAKKFYEDVGIDNVIGIIGEKTAPIKIENQKIEENSIKIKLRFRETGEFKIRLFDLISNVQVAELNLTNKNVGFIHEKILKYVKFNLKKENKYCAFRANVKFFDVDKKNMNQNLNIKLNKNFYFNSEVLESFYFPASKKMENMNCEFLTADTLLINDVLITSSDTGTYKFILFYSGKPKYQVNLNENNDKIRITGNEYKFLKLNEYSNSKFIFKIYKKYAELNINRNYYLKDYKIIMKDNILLIDVELNDVYIKNLVKNCKIKKHLYEKNINVVDFENIFNFDFENIKNERIKNKIYNLVN